MILHVLVIGLFSAFGLLALYISMEKDLINAMGRQKVELVGNMIDCNVRHQMMKGDTEAIPINLERLTASSTIEGLRILNLEGQILSSSRKDEIGDTLPIEDRAVVKRLYDSSESEQLFHIKPVSQTKSYIAIRNRTECLGCHAPDVPYTGILEVTLDESVEINLLQRRRNQGIIIALLTLVLLTIVIFRLYSRVIKKPLRRLKESMERVERGDLDVRLETVKLDEFGELYRSFSAMVDKLKLADQEISKLHTQQIEKAGHLASLGQLAAGLAHEIKNPIAGIKGSVEIISQQSAADDPRKEIFEEILKQTERIHTIIQDLLDYARPRQISKSMVDPNRCINDAIRMAEPQTGAKEIRFRFISLDEKVEVFLDCNKIQEVILNLLLNAITAIEKKGVITISLGITLDEISIRIEDTGKGISGEHLPLIFYPFFTTSKQGTGLGLSLCKEIIHAHGGTIDVSSEAGRGTAFIIRLPRNQPGEPA